MDPFQQLPAELIRQIIGDTADFVGTESLISVSRHARSVFKLDTYAITRVLLSSNPITSQLEIKRLLSNIAVIHSPSIFCASLDEYMEAAASNETLDSPHQLQTPDVACRVLHIAAQIQRLACICLSKLRREFVIAVGGLPAHAKNANMSFSWMEEYRVYWALWHLQCYSDLRKITGWRALNPHDARSHLIDRKWQWSDESMQALDSYFTLTGSHPLRSEEIWTVAVALEDLGARSFKIFPEGKLQPEYRSTLSRDLPPDTPIPLFSSIEIPRSVKTEHPVWSPPPTPEKNPVTSAWFLYPQGTIDVSGQAMVFRFLRNHVQRNGVNRLGMEDILRYRRCGVFLWDPWRMFSTGLLPNIFRQETATPDGGLIQPKGENSPGPFGVLSKWLEVGGAKQ
ncbi:unnamed protein product [Penicillium salamii]|nr:unnamed protein product [Penicillium salamii]